MPKATRRSLSATLLPLSLERGVELSLQRQLFEQLRELILGGRVKPGARLPSTRALAEELACSRNTVIGAYDQLFAEGYLECESGSGTYVSRVLPEELLRADLGRNGSHSPTTAKELNPWPPPGQAARHPAPALSKRGASLAAIRRDHPRQYAAFSPGMPETAHFPWETWNRLLGRTWRQPDRSLVRHGEAGGYAPLRKAIAKYLAAVRGVNCDWHQVIITSGGQQCIDLTVRCLRRVSRWCQYQ